MRQDLAERDLQVEKLRGQNAEIAREVVDATNEAGQCKNELRLVKDKLKKAQGELQLIEAQVQFRDQELAEVRNEQYQLLHKNKVEALRHSEGLQSQINALAKEKQGLEA